LEIPNERRSAKFIIKESMNQNLDFSSERGERASNQTILHGRGIDTF